MARVGQPLLNGLCKVGVVPSTHTFYTLTPDITRFIMKQQNKSETDQDSGKQQGILLFELCQRVIPFKFQLKVAFLYFAFENYFLCYLYVKLQL